MVKLFYSNFFNLARGNLGSGLITVSTASPPATPTGFAATAGNQQNTLTWDAQAEADTFTIRYGLTDNFGTSTELTDAATGTSFVHDAGESIVAGERYYYWIQAVNGDGESSFSTSVVARSYVTVANGDTASLVTPSGSWMLTTLFFRTGGFLPFGCTVAANEGFDIVVSLGDGIWDNQVTFESPYDVAVSGAFTFLNETGSSVTFWNTEP